MNIASLKEDKNQQVKLAVALVIIITMITRIFYGFSEGDFRHIQNTFWTPVLTAALIWITANFDFKKHKDGLFFIVFAAWAFFVCAANLYWPFPKYLEILFLSRGCFAFPFILSEKERELFLKTIAYVFTGICNFLSILSIIQIVAFVKDTSFPLADMLKIYVYDIEARIYTINIHPNTTGVSYTLAIVFAFLLIFSAKKIAVKVYGIITLVILTVAISFTDSRTALLVTMIAFAICISTWFYHTSDITDIAKKIAICGVLAVISMALIYFAGMAPRKILNSYAESLQIPPQIEQEISGESTSEPSVENTGTAFDISISTTENHTIIPLEPVPMAVLSDRDFSESGGFANFNNRDIIWNATASFIKDNPSILFKGYKPNMEIIAEETNAYTNIGWYYAHLHSEYVYYIVAFGIPGCLILLVAAVKMLINCFKLIFLKKSPADMALYVLPAIVVVLLMSGVVDINLVEYSLSPAMILCFTALGYISCYANKQENEK